MKPGDLVRITAGLHKGRTARILEQSTSLATGRPMRRWWLRVHLSRGRKEWACLPWRDVRAVAE